MLYLYDNAIVDDLQHSFVSADEGDVPAIRVVGPDAVLGIVAQLKQDEIKPPIVSLNRDDNIPVDTDRLNFTRLHKGVVAAFDKENNIIYHEKALPIKLQYDLTVLTTNTADMDEIMRELMFKYSSMYYLTIELPYEAKRKMRFAIQIDPDAQIQRSSASSEYSTTGTLHQSIITLTCIGCVLLTYTPRKLNRYVVDNEPTIINPSN